MQKYEIQHIILENERVKLMPLTLSNYHFLEAIGKQPNLVQFSPSIINTPKDLKSYVETALSWQKNHTALPFIVYDKFHNAYAGTTRFMNISWANKVAEIGGTWIGKQFQGTGLNTHMKFMMLQYAFEDLTFEKIEFRVDERNVASRKAIEKLGAVYEGTLRKNVILPDGFRRSSCCYGILATEWLAIKNDLATRL